MTDIEEIRKLTFRALAVALRPLALRRIRSDEGLALETSASESLHGGQFTLSTQLIKPNYLVILPPTQHHNFLHPLLEKCRLLNQAYLARRRCCQILRRFLFAAREGNDRQTVDGNN